MDFVTIVVYFLLLYFLIITKDVLSAAYIAVYNPTIPNKKIYT